MTWKEFWYDRPFSGKAAAVVGVALSIFHVYTALFGSLDAMMQRSVHLGLGLVLVFLLYPAHKEGKRSFLFDTLPIFGVILTIGYLLLNYDWVTAERFSLVTPLFWYEIVLGVIAIGLVIEAARRVVSPGLLYIAIGFLIYPFVAPFLPGLLRAAKTHWSALIDYNYVSTGGIFGIPLGVSATEIALFIIFGSILMKSGGSTLIANFAFSVAGRSVGGPAKVAVVGSSLFGTISGSSTANVATIGAVTIPMMKKAGYRSEFAAAVEAVASCGGQIMPPVMGAAAFVMAAFSGIPYSSILGYAIFPAVLYFLSLFVMVDLEARRLKLPLLKSDITLVQTMRGYGHMIVPIVVLVYTLVAGYTPRLAGGYAIVTALIMAQLKKSTRLSVPAMLSAFLDGARGMLIVLVSCAAAGIIVGVVDLTGIGHRLGTAFIQLAGGNLTVGLVLGLAISFLLGLGLPTTPAYILQVATVIPALIQLGLPPPAAHLFAFYYSCLALITPPDASAAFTAASIAKADGWKTGWLSTRMALVAFIVPFMFAYDQSLLLMGPLSKIIPSVITACAGVFCLAVAITGYFKRPLQSWKRVVALCAALLLIAPGLINALTGFALISFLAIVQYRGRSEVETVGSAGK
jgi:TRAP transporter 4TM/12TM fusion protein